MDDIKDIIEIRPYQESDRNFILNSWLHGFKHGCEYFRLIDHDIYCDVYSQILFKILEQANVDIKIVCLKETPEIILGYSVYEVRPKDIILHWIYVKPDWRDNGIGKMLAPEGITTVTHLTKAGRAILAKHQEVKFNPFLI